MIGGTAFGRLRPCVGLLLAAMIGFAGTSGGRADTMTDLVSVSLVRDGAPYQSGRWEAGVASLPPEQRSELKRLAGDAEANPPPAPTGPMPPDALTYTITLRSTGGTQVLTARDDTMTPEFQRLEAWLRTHATRRPPR